MRSRRRLETGAYHDPAVRFQSRGRPSLEVRCAVNELIDLGLGQLGSGRRPSTRWMPQAISFLTDAQQSDLARAVTVPTEVFDALVGALESTEPVTTAMTRARARATELGL